MGPGGRRPGPLLPLLKLAKKKMATTGFPSHCPPPPGQISGSSKACVGKDTNMGFVYVVFSVHYDLRIVFSTSKVICGYANHVLSKFNLLNKVTKLNRFTLGGNCKLHTITIQSKSGTFG